MSGVGGAEASTPGRRALRPAALLLAAAALAAAAAGLLLHRQRGTELEALRARARELRLDVTAGGELDRALARESDPGERRLALAWGALEAALGGGPEQGGELLLERLAAVRELARGALVELPASAEAPRLLGTAIALERLARRDSALLTAIEDWEAPLELARRRAPSVPAVERVLAAAYLEIWPGLVGQRRERAERSLRSAFEDPVFRARATDRWLELAGSVDEAARLLPDRPDAWNRLARAAATGGDLGRAAELLERESDALARELDERIARAIAARDRPGGARAAREAIDRALAATRPDRRFAERVAAALAARPAGPAGPDLQRAAARWLAWARPLVVLGEEPLPAAALDRLAGVAGVDLPSSEVAWVALLAGARPRAEQLARRADALWSEAWVPYLLIDARLRLEAGQTAAARERLERIHRSARRGLAWRRLSRTAGLSSTHHLGPLAAERWEPTEWELEERVPRLAFEIARPGRALSLELATPLRQPTLLVAELDGRSTPPVALDAGAKSVRLPLDLAPGPHLLRLTTRAGSAPALGLTILE